MKFLTDYEIQKGPLDKLIEHILETLDQKEEFKITENNVDKELLQKEKVTVKDLKDYFNFDQNNRTYGFPYIDEREEEEFKKTTFFGQRIVPAKDFFWVINAEKKEFPFGLVDTLFVISKVSVKENEERFEAKNIVDKEEKSFYYDYKKEIYYQVNLKAQNENTTTYQARQKMYQMAFKRLEEEDVKYIKLLNDHIPGILDFSNPHSHEILKYLQMVHQFIFTIEPYLPLKLIFAHTDLENYRHLRNYLDHLKSDLSEYINKLKSFEKKHGQRNFTDYDLASDSDIRKLFEDTNDFIRKKIQNIFEPRDKKRIDKKGKKPSSSQDGFYKYNDKRLFPNLAHIETSRHFKKMDQPGGKENRLQEERELLASLNKNRKNAHQEDHFELLTREQLAYIQSFPKGKSRSNEVLKILQELVRNRRLGQHEIKDYLKKYQ